MKKKRLYEELAAAERHVNSQVPGADQAYPYPLWHGWALREAFLAGIDWARERDAETKSEGR